jgi:hypothetical protein
MRADRSKLNSPVAACFLVTLANCCYGSGHPQIEAVTIPDNVCGPRCIAHIESLFGLHDGEEFIELVRDVQGNDLKQGSSLDALSRRLTAKGLHTVPLKLNWLQSLHAPESATIVHVLRGDGEGHFLVREQFGNSTRYWDGLNGYSVNMNPAYRPTGYCLVASNYATSCRLTRPGLGAWAISILVMVIGCYFVVRPLFLKKVIS